MELFIQATKVCFKEKGRIFYFNSLEDNQNSEAQLFGDFDQSEVQVSCPFSTDIGCFYVMHLLHWICSLFSCNPIATHHYRYY